MNSILKLGALALAAVALGAVPSGAHAQSLGGDVAVSSGMSAKEMVNYANESLQEMEDARSDVEKLLQAAEKTGDADVIDCVAVRARNIRALMDVSKLAKAAMNEALADGDSQLAEHEVRKIAVARSKVKQFLVEAEACLGDAVASSGTTELLPGETDEDAGGDDDTDPLVDDDIIGTDPPNVTPFE